MKDTLTKNLIGSSATRVQIGSHTLNSLQKSKCALEALSNIHALTGYIKSKVKNPSQETMSLANIAIESICDTVGLKPNAMSFEDLEQQTPQVTNVVNQLGDTLKSNMTELIPSIYADITNLAHKSIELESRLEEISKVLQEIPLDKAPLIENVKPDPEDIFVFTSKGLDFNAAVDVPTRLYGEFTGKVDGLLSDVFKWASNELSIRQSFIHEPFKFTSSFNNINFTDIPGLVDINVSVSSTDNTTIPECTIQLTEKSGFGNFRADLNTQSNMSADEWLEFNKNGRYESDKSVMKILNIDEMIILTNRIKLLNNSVIKLRIAEDTRLFMEKDEFGQSVFTNITNRLTNVSGPNDKTLVILDTLFAALSLRSNIDAVLLNYCLAVINSLYSVLNKNISFYNY